MNSRHHRRLSLKQRLHIALRDHHAGSDPAAEHTVTHHAPSPARQHTGVKTAELIQQAAPAAEGEKILAQAREEQARILKSATETRDRIIREAQEKARLEGDRLMDEMKKQIETEKESAIRDIRRQVALLSVSVAEKVIRTKLADDKEQTELISRLVDEMVESSK